ncbi:MAG: ATP-binding protein [Candidatus Ranarchaeia archaeon]
MASQRVTTKSEKLTVNPRKNQIYPETKNNSKDTIIEPQLPNLGPSKEIGFVIAAGMGDPVKVGDDSDLITTYIPSKFKKGLRLGDPLIIYDYVEGENFGGIITQISCPNLLMEQLETYLFQQFTPTQTLINNKKIDFLEQGILVTIQLFCTLGKNGNKGPVDYCPHPRASVFKPSIDQVLNMFGLPDIEEGISYGPILLGRKPFQGETQGDRGKKKYIPYVMRKELLYEHEMIIGTTGKGKSVKNKNDLKQFIEHEGGAVIVFDRHGEYEQIGTPPIVPEDINEKKIWSDCKMESGPIKNLSIFKWSSTEKKKEKSNEIPFTIPFNDIEPIDLQFYLPSLSPQGYVVLPKLVNLFNSTGLKKTFRNFFNWLKNTDIDPSNVDPRTKDAILRRMSNILEWGVFDAPDVYELKIEDLIGLRKVAVIPIHHISNVDIATIVVFHIINLVSKWKLNPNGGKKIPVSLIIDEAQSYFPRFVDENKKTYINRLVSRAKVICREGRKFKLRMQFATQRPEELNSDVLSIVNTITFFGMTPIQVQTLKRFMELPISGNRLINLPKRNAIVYSKDNTDKPITILIPFPLISHPIKKPKN